MNIISPDYAFNRGATKFLEYLRDIIYDTTHSREDRMLALYITALYHVEKYATISLENHEIRNLFVEDFDEKPDSSLVIGYFTEYNIMWRMIMDSSYL